MVGMNVVVLLADHAEVAEGKLFVNGAGWDTTGSPTAPFSVAVMIWVPWDRTNAPINFRLALVDQDGRPVGQQMPDGNVVPVEIGGDFEVGRPPGATEGAPMTVPLAFNFPPIPLQPGRYSWQAFIDGETEEHWSYAFRTQASDQQEQEPPQPPAQPGGPTDFRLP